MRPWPRSTLEGAFLLAVALGTGCQGEAGSLGEPEPNMSTVFFEADLETPVPLPAAARSIRDEAGPPLAPASPGGTGWTERYGSAARSSAVSAPLPAGEAWRVRWRVALNPQESSPRLLISAAGRTVVQTPESWYLIDGNGVLLSRGSVQHGDVVLDPVSGAFYCDDRSGFLGAWSLQDGAPRFGAMTYLGRGSDRRVLYREQGRLATLSYALPAPGPHPGEPPTRTVLEVLELGNLTSIKRGMLTGTRQAGVLTCLTRPFHVARSREALVVAVPDHVYRLGLDLQIQVDLAGRFLPLALSLDAAGRAYLLVQTGETTAFWLVDAEGRRRVALDLGLPPEALVHPPIVGARQVAHVVTPSRALAVQADGTRLWDYDEAPNLGEGCLTGDGQLVVAAGKELLAIDPAGKARVLWSAPARLRCAPIVSADGTIQVATGRAVLCLEPEPPD